VHCERQTERRVELQTAGCHWAVLSHAMLYGPLVTTSRRVLGLQTGGTASGCKG